MLTLRSQTDKIKDNHALVEWVLKDRRREENDSDFTWYAFAGKLERKGEVLLGMGIEEQAMVIIQRRLTPAAQKMANDKAAAKAKVAAKKDKAKKEAEKRKATEEALKKVKKEQSGKIKALEKENAKLKVRLDKAKDDSNKGRSTTEDLKSDNVTKLEPTEEDTNADKRSKSKNPESKTKDPPDKDTVKTSKSLPKDSNLKNSGSKLKNSPNKARDEASKRSFDGAKSNEKDTKSSKPQKEKTRDLSDSKVSKSERPNTSKESSKKAKEKYKKPDSTSEATVNQPFSAPNHATTEEEMQALKQENARLEAALMEANASLPVKDRGEKDGDDKGARKTKSMVP